ncbi:MAG: hypothetical protein ACSI46_09115 [Gloeotrichia echinulata DVL01]|jgi:hypothetical protein|nr:hypothetical protein [Gloeotrichia echinulata DEX184]
MSQNPLIESGAQSSKTSGLKPPLAAALASLEVQLDQELARYRRTRNSARTLNQSRLGNQISSPSPPLTAITTTSEKTQPLAPEITTNAPPVSPPHTPQGEPAPATVKAEAWDNLELSSPSTNTETPASSPDPTSSIVPAEIKVTKTDNSSPSDDSPKQPEDYLESSEALLRSLTDEPPSTSQPSNSHDSLLSPLGVGSMLLLLVASLSLGYFMFNPKILSQLNIAKLFNSNSSTPANNTDKPQNNLSPQPQQELTPIPKYPNLAAKEFPEVRNPNDVVGLKPKVQPSPTALPNPAAIEPPLNLNTLKPVPKIPPVAPQIPPVASLNVPATPTTSDAQKAPEPAQSQPNAQIKPAGDGLYHIVVDNQGDRAFSSARQIIPDAYLSLDNKLIYLGAFKTKQEALQQIQQLQAKGIKARIQQQ